jgi:hypothetical protein
MRLADHAWNEVDTMAIQSCWKKAGILPKELEFLTVPSVIAIPVLLLLKNGTKDRIAKAETAISLALDTLVSCGALQKKNQMNLEEILNPVNAREAINEGTDK